MVRPGPSCLRATGWKRFREARVSNPGRQDLASRLKQPIAIVSMRPHYALAHQRFGCARLALLFALLLVVVQAAEGRSRSRGPVEESVL